MTLFYYVAPILSAYMKNMLICSIVCLYMGHKANIRNNLSVTCFISNFLKQ